MNRRMIEGGYGMRGPSRRDMQMQRMAMQSGAMRRGRGGMANDPFDMSGLGDALDEPGGSYGRPRRRPDRWDDADDMYGDSRRMMDNGMPANKGFLPAPLGSRPSKMFRPGSSFSRGDIEGAKSGRLDMEEFSRRGRTSGGFDDLDDGPEYEVEEPDDNFPGPVSSWNFVDRNGNDWAHINAMERQADLMEFGPAAFAGDDRYPGLADLEARARRERKLRRREKAAFGMEFEEVTTVRRGSMGGFR